LRFGRLTARRFELKPERVAATDRDNVGDARHHPEPFEDTGLNRLALAAVGNVESERLWRTANLEVLEHGALDLIFWPCS
jgi:hypothetical protein